MGVMKSLPLDILILVVVIIIVKQNQIGEKIEKSNIKNVEKAYKIKISKKLDKGFCGKVLY